MQITKISFQFVIQIWDSVYIYIQTQRERDRIEKETDKQTYTKKEKDRLIDGLTQTKKE